MKSRSSNWKKRRLSPATGLMLGLMTMLLLACGLLGGDGDGDAGSEIVADAPPEDALVVRMLYGSEKQAWIEDVTARFNDQGNETSSGETIFVDAVPIGSGESMDQILSGQEQPAVWSPASGILVPIANQEWAAANDGATLTDANSPPLVLSPVVIAMWQPMAEALGWPDESLSWNEIATIAGSNQSWADFGHPEWGPFQFGHTHPEFSNSGITSILAIAYAATDKTRDLTVDDVQSPDTAAFMESVQQGVIHYGRSTGFFARQMFNRGPAYLSGAVLYENLVVESYDRERFPDMPFPVVAIYPEEGSFWSDHPYAILDGPWMTDELREGAEIYRDYLLAPEQQQAALQYGFRPADTSIAITEPIVPANGVDPNQPQTLLSVPEADVTRTVLDLWRENKKNVEVQVVLDVSGSMNEDGRLEQAKEALNIFIDQLADEDELSVLTFSSSVGELTPLGPLGPKREQVLQRVDNLFANGGTRLIDTVYESYQAMEEFPAGERIRALVVLSDGEDTDSARDPQALLDLLAQDETGQSIKVFTIAYGAGGDANLMSLIAEASGATTYESDPAQIEQVYRDIATFF